MIVGIYELLRTANPSNVNPQAVVAPKMIPLVSEGNKKFATKNKGNANPHTNGANFRQSCHTPAARTLTNTTSVKIWLNGHAASAM